MRPFLLAAAVALVGAASAHATLITLSTRASTDAAQPTAKSYADLVNSLEASAPGQGFADVTLPIFANVMNRNLAPGGANANVAYDFRLDFAVTAAIAGTWDLRLGVDFGRGGAVFIDGQAAALNTGNMWWNNDFATAGQSFVLAASLAGGNHEIRVIGLEDCCDGGMQGQFRAPGAADFTIFAAADGLATKIPEPASAALVAIALAMLRRRRRSAAPPKACVVVDNKKEGSSHVAGH